MRTGKELIVEGRFPTVKVGWGLEVEGKNGLDAQTAAFGRVDFGANCC
jgi:hypothetical protein